VPCSARPSENDLCVPAPVLCCRNPTDFLPLLPLFAPHTFSFFFFPALRTPWPISSARDPFEQKPARASIANFTIRFSPSLSFASAPVDPTPPHPCLLVSRVSLSTCPFLGRMCAFGLLLPNEHSVAPARDLLVSRCTSPGEFSSCVRLLIPPPPASTAFYEQHLTAVAFTLFFFNPQQRPPCRHMVLPSGFAAE